MMALIGLKRKIRTAYYTIVSEKRKYSRIPISVRVTKLDSGSFTYYQASNISVGGMFLKADNPLQPGSRLRLSFSLGEDEGIEVDAEVVRVQPPGADTTHPSGMGIKFLGLTPESRDAIKSFVAKKT